MRLIDADELERVAVIVDGRLVVHLTDIHKAPTVELDESIIQGVLNKRCMTVVANEYLVALHGKGPHGKWIFRNGGYYKCSNCGEVERAEKNYCSNCGAKMDKKEADNEQ